MKNKFIKKINASAIFKNNKNDIFNETASFCNDRNNLSERRENSFYNNYIIDEIPNNHKKIFKNKKKNVTIGTPTIFK